MCRPGRKGRADLTSSPPSSHLAVAVPIESPTLLDGNYRQGLRSLWHLSQHLTTRADDNHAAPTYSPLPDISSLILSSTFQARVRFLAYHRIKPHVPPLVRAPVNSFEFQPCGRTPQVDNLSISLDHRHYIADSELSSFTVRTTRVSNPVRSPHFRASASIVPLPAAFAIGLLCHIYAFHRYLTHSAGIIHILVNQFQRHPQGLAPTFHR